MHLLVIVISEVGFKVSRVWFPYRFCPMSLTHTVQHINPYNMT